MQLSLKVIAYFYSKKERVISLRKFLILAIKELEGGEYTINTILKVIKQITDWALAIGISLAGVALVISFVMYAVVDVDQKARVKQRIIQTLFGVGGIILAISLVNIIIRLFT